MMTRTLCLLKGKFSEWSPFWMFAFAQILQFSQIDIEPTLSAWFLVFQIFAKLQISGLFCSEEWKPIARARGLVIENYFEYAYRKNCGISANLKINRRPRLVNGVGYSVGHLPFCLAGLFQNNDLHEMYGLDRVMHCLNVHVLPWWFIRVSLCWFLRLKGPADWRVSCCSSAPSAQCNWFKDFASSGRAPVRWEHDGN